MTDDTPTHRGSEQSRSPDDASNGHDFEVGEHVHITGGAQRPYEGTVERRADTDKWGADCFVVLFDDLDADDGLTPEQRESLADDQPANGLETRLVVHETNLARGPATR